MTNRKTGRWKNAALWLLAVVLMLASAVYQRLTGPTHPQRGELTVGGEALSYRLLRSETSSHDARVAIPDPGHGTSARLFYKRYKTDDPFTGLDMRREPGDAAELAAYLPAQPAAGKLEYFLIVYGDGGEHYVPGRDPGGGGTETVIIRFKDPVPAPLLIAHVAFMFFAILIGIRAGLGALLAPDTMAKPAWISLACMTAGGMILGPLVQKAAFGEYWVGFPWGVDLTDNKTLIMWLAWLVACAVLWRLPQKQLAGRITVAAAAVVMTAVYLIPHSLRGSELDYDQVDRGIPASEAIGTGD